jgi:hypothetical protein
VIPLALRTLLVFAVALGALALTGLAQPSRLFAGFQDIAR